MYNVNMKKIIYTLILIFAFGLCAFGEDINRLRDDATMLYSANKINEAKASFEKIPEDKRDAQTWLLLSNIEQDLQNEAKAEEYLKKAIEKDSKYYKAYYNLGNIYFNKGNIEEALKNYKLAARYNRKNGYIYTNIGCCYLAKKNLGLARINFNKAVTLNPRNPNNYYNLAYIYKTNGKSKKAQELLNIYNNLMQEMVN